MTDSIPTFHRDQYLSLKQDIDALAGVCDGAASRDQRGFDGSDTRTGHLLAFLPLAAWPLCMFHRVWLWTRKYAQQLVTMHLECAEIAEPPIFEGQDCQIALHPDGAGWLVVFPYDDELIAAFKGIPGGALHTQPIGASRLVFRYRSVQPVAGAGHALLAFARCYSFPCAPGVEELAQQVEEEAAPPAPTSRVVLAQQGLFDAFALFFPRDVALNEQVKAIPGRMPDDTGGFHWLLPATPRAGSLLRAFLERNPQFVVSPDAQMLLCTLATPGEEG